MQKTLGVAAILVVLGTNMALAQSNPNQGATTGSPANQEQRQNSTTGNPANPGPRGN
jgi:hypothetical protein